MIVKALVASLFFGIFVFASPVHAQSNCGPGQVNPNACESFNGSEEDQAEIAERLENLDEEFSIPQEIPSPVIGGGNDQVGLPLLRTVLGYLKWVAGIAGLGAFLLIGLQMSIGRRNRSASAATALGAAPWVAVGLVLVGLSSGLAEWVLEIAHPDNTRVAPSVQEAFDDYQSCLEIDGASERSDCIIQWRDADGFGGGIREQGAQFAACELIGDSEERDICHLNNSGL